MGSHEATHNHQYTRECFVSSLSYYFVADVVVVGCGLVDLDLSQRFGSHELKKEFLEPSVLGDKVKSVSNRLQSRKFSQGHIKMNVHFPRFSYLLLSGGLSWC